MSTTYTSSSSYTVADIEKVLTRFSADMIMIADSTQAITREKARTYVRDVERLVKKGYLASVDVTLVDFLGNELRAVKYDVDTDAANLTSSRPGGVLWPYTNGGSVRIILSYHHSYDDDARKQLQPSLEVSWGPTDVDISHRSLRSDAGRNYESNGFGMQRKDFSQ